MKNKFKRLSFISIAAALIMIFSISVFTAKNAFADTNGSVLESIKNEYSESNNLEIKSGEKIYCNADITEDFCPDSVIVILDEKISNLFGIQL